MQNQLSMYGSKSPRREGYEPKAYKKHLLIKYRNSSMKPPTGQQYIYQPPQKEN